MSEFTTASNGNHQMSAFTTASSGYVEVEADFNGEKQGLKA